MATRPTITIVLLTRQVILRADFNRSHALAEIWSQARPDVQEWPSLIEIALSLGPKPGHTVFVLSSDLWTQTLSLTNISTISMSPTEIASALNFEAEALSGQSAFESNVAASPLPEKNGYWIVQARSADVERANEIARKAGSRLGGLGHPGGLPVSLTDSASTGRPWVRIEGWPDAVLMLRGDAQGPPMIQVLNADPQMGRWKSEWDGWRGNDPAEVLAGPGVIFPSLNVADGFALDNETKLAAWLTAWAKHLSSKDVGVPLFRPARKPISSGQRWAMSLGLAATVLLCCVAIHYWLNTSIASSRAQLQHFQDQDKQLKALQKKGQEEQVKQKELQAQVESTEKNSKVLATHRLRLLKLMTTLREHHPEDLFVEKLEVEAGEPRLRGRCLHPELADQFASKLGQVLLEHGWEVLSPKKEALRLAANGGPWSFDIQFRSTKDMTVDTRDPKKGKK